MIAHILHESKRSCTAFVGGVMSNYNSNLILSSDPNAVMVVEADEFDRSFLKLSPNLAVITSMDADHLDIYGSKEELQNTFQQFATRLDTSGKLIHKSKLPINYSNVLTYSITGKADYFTSDITVNDKGFVFTVQTPHSTIKNIQLGIAGRHNVENALAATAICRELKVSDTDIRYALQSFKGIKRRFEYIVNTDSVVYIDDYAHHPEELRSVISSVRELYPTKKITGIFQPHLYTRTRDFMDDFAKSLDLVDELWLLDIYPARELPIAGISSAALLEKCKLSNKKIVDFSSVKTDLKNQKIEVLLTLGAGDIDTLVEPIKAVLLN